MKTGQLIGTGNTANVYEWGKSEVIKIFHDPVGAAYEAAKEAHNAEMIDKLKLRAPGFSGIVEYEGQASLVYEKIEGPTMLSCIEPTKTSVSHHGKVMAQLQFELHQVETGFNSNLKSELSKHIHIAPVITEPEKAFVTDLLSRCPEGQALCHYDFHPGNIILSPNGPIIIDWLNALVGHPLADVTRTLMMINSNALPPSVPAWLKDEGCRELFGTAYLDEYRILSGINQCELEEWLVPTLAVRLSELQGEEQTEIADKLKALL